MKSLGLDVQVGFERHEPLVIGAPDYETHCVQLCDGEDGVRPLMFCATPHFNHASRELLGFGMQFIEGINDGFLSSGTVIGDLVVLSPEAAGSLIWTQNIDGKSYKVTSREP